MRTRWRTILTNTKGPQFLIVTEDWLCFDYRYEPRGEVGGGRAWRGAGTYRAAIGRNGRLFYTQTENIKHCK